jgi:hypothetical protein
MIAKELVDIDTDDAVGEALGRLRGFIRANARRLAADDPAFAVDLEQEGGIAVWRLDPTRFEVDDEPYLRGGIFKQMQRAARNERRKGMGVRVCANAS